MLGRRGAIALTCAAVLAMPAAALANAYDDTLREYQKTGAVDGCKYTAAELSQAKDQTPANIKDIAPGYPAQLALATQTRAKGCSKSEDKSTSSAAAPAGTGTGASSQPPAASTGATTQPPATTTINPNGTPTNATTAPAPAPTTTPAPAPATQPAAASTSSHKGARLALIVVAALLLMLLALWAFARWWAWEPEWLVRWRHATGEAGWRASAAWAEFTDWLRLGR